MIVINGHEATLEPRWFRLVTTGDDGPLAFVGVGRRSSDVRERYLYLEMRRSK